MKNKRLEGIWTDNKGNIVIMNGIALKKIKKNQKLILIGYLEDGKDGSTGIKI